METIDGHTFFMKRIDQDNNFQVEMKAMLHSTSKEDLKQEIIQLREDLHNIVPSGSLVELKHKELITVSDFAILYSINKQTQTSLRSRIRDPLPFIQIIKNGSIIYKKSVVDKWLENYEK